MRFDRRTISNAPRFFRIVAPAFAPITIDRETKTINGVSVVTAGEARGHELWLDGEFLNQVVFAGNAAKNGIKSRWTHPGLSGDGMGTQLGRLRNFRSTGAKVLADLNLHERANQEYVEAAMDLAEDAPDQFGASIVFEPDVKAEKLFAEKNSKDEKFTSPDPANKNNYMHARLLALRAGDLVDEPAANPDGLFCEGGELALMGGEMLDYIFGASDRLPQYSGVHPDRARAFFHQYLTDHNLTVIDKNQLARLRRTIEILKDGGRS